MKSQNLKKPLQVIRVTMDISISSIWSYEAMLSHSYSSLSVMFQNRAQLLDWHGRSSSGLTMKGLWKALWLLSLFLEDNTQG